MIKIGQRRTLIRGISFGLLFLGSASPAQQNIPPVTDDAGLAEDAIDEIIVTGSHIPRRTSTLPTPTTVIDEAVLERSGTANPGDVMHAYPAFVAGVGSNGNNNKSNGINKAGQELLNLRGLGTNRTLVLVNGRRQVPSDVTAVDIGMLPMPMIERIEVITGGASAIYGADAVAGVVNVILKDDFEGIQIDLLSGISAESDGELADINITLGRNFSGGRGNVFASLNYTDDSGIPATARVYSNRTSAFVANPADTGPADGVPDSLFFDDVTFRFFNTEGVLHLVNNATTNMLLPMQEVAFSLPLFPDDPLGLVFDPLLSDGLQPGQALYDSFTFDRATGEVRPFEIGAVCDLFACSIGDGFRTAESNLLSTPIERTAVNLGWRYDFGAMTLSAGARYGRIKSTATSQPFFGHFPFFGPLEYIRIERDNPFLPAAMAAEMDARGLTAAPLAVPGLQAKNVPERETYQVTVSGKGGFSDEVSFDFYGQYGEVDTERRQADVLLSRYFQALDATTDGSGNAVCRDPSGGCVPFNPFNRGASAEARAFTDAGLLQTAGLSQLLFGFSIHGRGWELPAGAAQYAAGIEYRRESLHSIPDDLMQARDPVTGFGLGLIGMTRGPIPPLNSYFPPIFGDYSVGEVFGEVLFPLVSDRAGFRSLDVDFAARYSGYDIVDSSLTYKTGLNWTVNDALRFRGTLSRAVRAPSISELFEPAAPQQSPVNDPCHVDNLVNGRNPANRQANCAALGLPPDFQATAGFRTLIFEGNPGLAEETADTFTAGVIISIGDAFDVSIDYWDIEIEDAIFKFNADDTLANCVDGAALDPVFCSLVTRAADGQIVSVDIKDINAGLFRSSGIDLESTYAFDFQNDNTLSFNLVASYLDEVTFIPNAGDPGTQDKRAGEANHPRVRALLSTIYDTADWRLSWDLNYIGSSRIFNQTQPEEYSYNKVESKIYHSLNARYRFDDRWEVLAGIRNLTDDEPPRWLNLGNVLYDAIGRYYFAGARFAYQ